MARAWTAKEDEALRAGQHPRGRSDAAVRRRRDRLGLTARRRPLDEERVGELAHSGMSTQAIAQTLGVGYHAVLGARARRGLRAPVGRPKRAPMDEVGGTPAVEVAPIAMQD